MATTHVEVGLMRAEANVNSLRTASENTASSAICTPSRSSAWTGRSTSCACRTSTRRRCSPPCSTQSAAAASRSRRSSTGAARKQLYLPDTNVLLTRFLDADGVAEVSDFMPVEDAGQAHNLVRRAKTVRGEVRFRMRCEPRFDYARATHTVERRSDTEVLFVGRSATASWRCACGRRCRCVSRTARRWPSSRCAPTQSASFVLEVVLDAGAVARRSSPTTRATPSRRR